MKILFVADIHIKLGQRKVPKDWQYNRYMSLVGELNNIDCDLMVIGGDTLDSPTPSLEEIELYFDFVSRIKHETIIFEGNHELITKNKSVLDNFADETNRCNPLVTVVDTWRSEDFDIIGYKELHKKWSEPKSKLLFTHVRAELPEHMKTKPEVDLARFDVYDMVLSGDLHDHQMSQTTEAGTPLLYPGSPLSTSFHREIPQEANGVFTIDTETLAWEWHDLKHLPHLLRKKVQSTDEMVKDPYNHVIYEIEGDVMDLKKVKDSELLDKKINTNVSKDAKLNLKDKKIDEELQLYLEEVEGLDDSKVERCMTRFANEVTIEDI
ncbi:putative recombination endonuclease subunit D12 [Vibrio phage VCPH]|nr:putative recombination endonuclease subunit D12 [Vibrio phage VCPH]